MDGLKNAKKEIGVGLAQVAAFGFAVKKAFDFAEQGAMIGQTADSFELLIRKTGAETDLLEQLRVASRGTITDQQLMASTATLLAGAQGELVTQLANSTPQLLEIAKAAQKLNPSLGDTTFLYNSLATGIKRASPLILDNLGLTISIEEANRKYAESLGKTVAQLTEEEKKIALLNATLAAGDVLIQQVGGNVDSAADAFARLRTNIGNAANELKQNLGTAVLPMISTWNAAFEAEEKVQLALERGIITQKEYNAMFLMSNRDYVDMVNNQIVPALEEYEEGLREVDEANASFDGKLMNFATTTLPAVAEAVFDVDGAFKDLQLTIAGPLGAEMDNFAEKQAGLEEQAASLRAEIEELEGLTWLSEDQKGQLDENREKLQDIGDQIQANADAHEDATKRILFDLLAQRAALDGLSEAEFEVLTAIAEGWGLIDEKTANFITTADGAWRKLEEGESTLEVIGDINAALEDLAASAASVAGDYDINYQINVSGELPPGASSATYTPPEPRAAGGPVVSGQAYLINEGRPEVFVPGASGAMVPVENMAGQGNAELLNELRGLRGDLASLKHLDRRLLVAMQSAGKKFK
jgi:hypothetical protein